MFDKVVDELIVSEDIMSVVGKSIQDEETENKDIGKSKNL